MKLAAAIILYNPENSWISNVMSYINFVEKIYIFDNSQSPIKYIPEEISQKSLYIHSGKNEGIAVRLNQAISKSFSDGFEYLLTMDQDTYFEPRNITHYLDKVCSESANKNITAFGIHIDFKYDPKIIGQDILITSGSIIRIDLAKKIKGFDENLFIDFVDTEFCLKSWINGYTTKGIQGIRMEHQLGIDRKVLTPFLKTKMRKFHTPKRLYYIIRNHLYTRDKYPTYRSYLPFSITINEIKNGILYNGSPFLSVYNIFKGVYHYFINSMGK